MITRTRKTRRNLTRSIAFGHGDNHLGMRVLHTCWDGTERIGTITRYQGLDPVAEFADGTWARLDASNVLQVREVER